MAKFKLDIQKPDMVAVAKMVAATYQFGFREGFRTGGGMTDDSEGGWKPSAKLKGKRQGQKKGDTKTLVDTGKLRQSVKAKVISKYRISITADARNNEGEFYGYKHNFGTDGMPKREFIGDSRRIQGRVVRKLKTAVKKALLNR